MKHSALIDNLLQEFTHYLGPDYDKYRNHVHRVFLNCLLLDREKENEEKYAIAAVFHDIGIWTDHTIDYLDPSIEQAKKYLNDTGRPHWKEEISLMIDWHHKVSGYKGPYSQTTGTFRKADWIDVSLGLLQFGADKKETRQNRRRFPNRGFHWFLVKKITRNFFRHPLHPLPMFRK